MDLDALAEAMYGDGAFAISKAYQLDKTAARGYGGAHQAERKKYTLRMAEGEKFTCSKCGNTVGGKWQLGHNDGQKGYAGPQCTSCNTGDGGRRGGQNGTGEAKARWKDGKPHNRLAKGCDDAAPVTKGLSQYMEGRSEKKRLRVVRGRASIQARLDGLKAQGEADPRIPGIKTDGKGNAVWSDSPRTSIVKFDDEKRQVFGWAQVASLNGKPVLDRQGDMVTIEELSKAAHDFVANSRKGGIMHRRTPSDEPVQVGHVIESIIVDEPIKKVLGLPDNTPEGWFIGMQVTDESAWQDYKAGKFPDFSVHGSGKRKPVL